MTVDKVNCWCIQEVYYEKSDTSERLIEEEIIALGFDKDVDLREAINQNIDIEKYIEDKCEYLENIKQFTKIKSGDYFLYIDYEREDNLINKIEYIGQITQDFNIGYKLDSSLGHTLPIKWINKKSERLSQSIYTWDFDEVDNSEIKKYLGYVQLENDEKLIKELECSNSKIFYIDNYLYDNIDEDYKSDTITISVDTREKINNLKNIRKGDYIIFIKSENTNDKKNITFINSMGICKLKHDFKKEFRVGDQIDYKLEVEYVREPKSNEGNFISTTLFSKKILTRNISNNIFKSDLNTILYGPPGTGKTYNIANEAVKIYDILDYKKI